MSFNRLYPCARKSGFTLIELLIVIAIIAILALIAIPNFLEAQTRSKISRSLADMRSVATAIEAYFIDNNSYIWSAHDGTARNPSGGTPTTNENYFQWYSNLTTPVAFITSIPRDPFGQLNIGLRAQPYYNFYSGNVNEATGSDTTMPRTVFCLMSKGPDRTNEIEHLLWRGSGSTLDTAFFDVTDIDISAGLSKHTTGLVYDPTNGTISQGDIYRLPSSKIPKFFRPNLTYNYTECYD